MKYIIADPDEQNSIELKKLIDDYKILNFSGSFTNFEEAEKSICGKPPDVAFIRTGKAEINAFKLVAKMRAQNKFSIIVFLGCHEDDAVEAFEQEVDGFILMPFDQVKVTNLLMRIVDKRRF